MKGKKEEKNGKNYLQSRLILVMVFGIIVIFVLVIGLSLYNIGSHLMKEADARYQLVTDNVSQEITTWFTNQGQNVLSHKAALEISDNFDPEYLNDYFTTIINNYNEDGYMYDLYFVNTDNIMSSGYGYVPDPSIDFRTRLWYLGAMKNEGLFYSSPYKDSNLDRYVVTMSTPCYRANGDLAGVLALDIFVDTLFAIADDKVIDGNSYVFLIDQNMGITTHPNPEYAYVDDEPIKAYDIPNGKYQYIVDYITGNYDSKTTNSHYNVVDFDGVNRSIYVSKIECCGWYAVTAIESSVFITPLMRTLAMVIVALIVCVVGGVIATRAITGRIIRQLNEANEAALAANETKGVFLANMSHEIRTPINAIIGMNEMVIRENNDPTINDYALDIASASRSLVTIVNDILDFSKIESGKMEIVNTEFNFASIINDVVNMSESRLGNKGLALFFEVDPTIPVGLIGDEVRIKQIILNLMTNAIKYTNEGFVTMRATYSKQEYGINLNVFVKDTGIGISEENLEQLFESFQRFDTKRNRSIEGTGLGLSITKRLVASMGGFINVTSKKDEGSEFSFSIPLKVTDSTPFVQVEHADSVKLITLFGTSYMEENRRDEIIKIREQICNSLKLDVVHTDSFDSFKEKLNGDKFTHILIDQRTYFANENYFEELSKDNNVIVLQKRGDAQPLPATVINLYTPLYVISMAALLNNKRQADSFVTSAELTFRAPTAKIMIVDDNEMNLKVAAGLMKPYDMKITTVDSGIKAIDILKEDPTYDVIFMDHMMPIMDGIEATKLIRKLEDPYFEKLPIIALTANTINNAKQLFLSSGFNDFLAKPININFLDRMLRMHLPKEKILLENRKSFEAMAQTNASSNSIPMSSIFDAQIGITYTGGNQELYLDVLKEYVDNYISMKEILSTTKASEDWPNYIIKVHALKSMSLTIGAVPLSEFAKDLELSGKSGNYDPIISKTDSLLEEYDKVVEKATEYLVLNKVSLKESTDYFNEINDISEDLDKETINRYAAELKEAIGAFDSDKAEEIYGGMGDYQKLFEKVLSLVNNFEYDEAVEELDRIVEL